AFDCRPLFASVDRTVDGCIHHIDYVRTLWIDSYLFEIPATVPETFIAGQPGPCIAGIIRTEHAAFFGIDDCINSIAVRWRDGDADVPAALEWNTFRDLFP